MKSADLQEGANEKSIEKRGGALHREKRGTFRGAPHRQGAPSRSTRSQATGEDAHVDSRHLRPTREEGTKPHKNAHLWTRATADSTGNVQGSIAKDKILTGKELQILLMYLCWLLIASLRAEKYNLEACLPPA